MSATTDTHLRNAQGNWVLGTWHGWEVQAKVFETPSRFGMEQEGRISQLWIALPGSPRVVLYDFDRGDLGKNHLKDAAVAEIAAALVAFRIAHPAA